MADSELADNLHSFNLKAAIDDAVAASCTPTCKCHRCRHLLAFEDWCQSLSTLPPSFSELLHHFYDSEELKFLRTSEHGFMDFSSGDIHVAFSGHDCTDEFDTCDAITCQGLYENNYEPVFLCLANESLTRFEIQEIAKELVLYIRSQLRMPNPTRGGRFETSDYRLGTEAMTAQLNAKFDAKLSGHHALREVINRSGTANPAFKTVKDKILNEQDKIVWLGKNTGEFEGHEDSVTAKQLIVGYLSEVGVYSERTVSPIAEKAPDTEVLGKTKIIMSIGRRYSGSRKFSAFQPNFCSHGDPKLWVGRPQGSGGKAIKLVEKSLGHPVDHLACECGDPAEFEAIGSLKNIRWSKSQYRVLKVCVFGYGELDEYERPPLDAIRSKN